MIELNNRYEVARTLVQLSRVYHLEGNAKDAAKAQQRAMTIFIQLGAQADLQALQIL